MDRNKIGKKVREIIIRHKPELTAVEIEEGDFLDDDLKFNEKEFQALTSDCEKEFNIILTPDIVDVEDLIDSIDYATEDDD